MLTCGDVSCFCPTLKSSFLKQLIPERPLAKQKLALQILNLTSTANPSPGAMAPSDEDGGVHIQLPDEAASEPSKENRDDLNGSEKHHQPRDSKGWDGKLRVDRRALVPGADAGAESDPEEEEEEGPPPELIDADEDIAADYEDDIEEIDLIQCRISNMDALRLQRFKKLERLCLRQNLIQDPILPENVHQTLKDLDLYDNLISHIRGLDGLFELTSLDLSFNKIKHIKRVNHLRNLTDLYFVQNKIQTIENLEGLPLLRNLELGGNKIREIQGLETLTALEELWLGKNKITELKGLQKLGSLKILSIQANRLTSIAGLENLTSLEELHISHNALTSLNGLTSNTTLRVIDISNNPITSLSGLEPLTNLEELWASYCQLTSFEEVLHVLGDKEHLETVYFEGNPLQTRQPVLYRNKVRLALPQVRQIDASEYYSFLHMRWVSCISREQSYFEERGLPWNDVPYLQTELMDCDDFAMFWYPDPLPAQPSELCYHAQPSQCGWCTGPMTYDKDDLLQQILDDYS